MTGNELLLDATYEIPEFTNSGAEQTRMLAFFNSEKRILESMLANRPGRHLLKSKTFSTVADRSPNRYSRPADFQKVSYMERVISDTTGDYERILPVQHLSEKGAIIRGEDRAPVMIVTNNTGRPIGYLIGDDFIHLFPISDAVYTVRLWYLRRYADIAATASELDIPEDFAEVLVQGGRFRLYKYLKQDTQRMFQEVLVAREQALQSVVHQVVDGPRVMNLEIPPEDWA